jgi:hypothetical protein
MSSRFERRLSRLEERIGTKPGPQHVIITNVPCDCEESQYSVKISSELWAESIGRAFTSDQIDQLRKEYADK